MKSTEAGFSLPELLIAMGVMLLVSGAATMALLKMTTTQATIWNRTQMHSGIRGATEVLQQEVGQAGRVALPAGTTMTLTSAVTGPGMAMVNLSSTDGLFMNEKIVVDGGDRRETVTVMSIYPSPMTGITANFNQPHDVGARVQAMGAFATGVVPKSMSPGGSGDSNLKLYGDINDDGNMVYVEYVCNTGAGGSFPHSLTRQMMPYDTIPPDRPNYPVQVLLGSVYPNPDNSACFNYQEQAVTVGGTQYKFVTDVAITLTVQTQQRDPVTKQFQLETKALLNVSPRNVFNVWELSTLGISDRTQPMPTSVQLLINP